MRRIAKRLNELEVPYAIAGGMALYSHGLRRFTDDVDILVTQDALDRIHEACDGRGYVRPFETSKNLRDAELKVKIEFIVTGQFPGDGKPKAVAFPDPAQVFEVHDGIKVVNLPTLVELKLASGISALDRDKDLADVVELIKTLDLPEELADSLNPYVRPTYEQMWRRVRGVAKKYVKLWRTKPFLVGIASLEELSAALQRAQAELAAMQADGVTLHPGSDLTQDLIYLMTTSREIADRYDMEEESTVFPNVARR
jgi:hypothetical protein